MGADSAKAYICGSTTLNRKGAISKVEVEGWPILGPGFSWGLKAGQRLVEQQLDERIRPSNSGLYRLLVLASIRLSTELLLPLNESILLL